MAVMNNYAWHNFALQRLMLASLSGQLVIKTTPLSQLPVGRPQLRLRVHFVKVFHPSTRHRLVCKASTTSPSETMNHRLLSVGSEAAMVPQSRASPFAQGVVVGVLAAVAAFVFAAVFFLALRTDRYDLDHWKLNFRVPVDSMWMNLGYWYVVEAPNPRRS